MTHIIAEEFYSACRKLTYEDRDAIIKFARALKITQSLSNNPPPNPCKVTYPASVITESPAL